MAYTGFISQPRSFNSDTIPFDSYSSASALPLAMMFLLACVCFKGASAEQYHACA